MAVQPKVYLRRPGAQFHIITHFVPWASLITGWKLPLDSFNLSVDPISNVQMQFQNDPNRKTYYKQLDLDMAACHLMRPWNPRSPHSLASYLCVIPPASYPPDRPFCSALFHSHQRVYYQIKCRAAVVDLSNYSATLLGFDQPCLLLARAHPPIHLGTPARCAHLASCSTPEYWFSNIIWRTWWVAAHHKIHPLLYFTALGEL